MNKRIGFDMFYKNHHIIVSYAYGSDECEVIGCELAR